jgi:hypothetical protein
MSAPEGVEETEIEPGVGSGVGIRVGVGVRVVVGEGVAVRYAETDAISPAET